MSVIVWVNPADCDPPHGLDLASARDANKVNMLAETFLTRGFDRSKSALIGYPLGGRIQLLSGTHRHEAARRVKVQLPVVLWLRSTIEETWGDLDRWMRLMQDFSVTELETWDREDVERMRLTAKGAL